MRLKRYLVADMKEALRAIRTDLGPDAVIVHSQARKPKGWQRLWQRPQIEVLAAVEDDVPLRQDTVPHPTAVGEQGQRLRVLEERLEAISRSIEVLSGRPQGQDGGGASLTVLDGLRRQDLSADIVSRLAQGSGASEDAGALRVALKQMLPPCTRLTLCGHAPDVFLFLGPTGVGKTTTLAKVAAELILHHGRRVALATADTFRVAAVPQIEIYAALLDAPLQVAYEPDELRRAVEGYAGYDVVLVDTPGRSTSDETGLSELEQYLGAVPGARRILLLEAGAHLANLRKVAQAFQAERCEGLIFTKLDETQVYGPLFSIAVEIGKPVFYLTTGQNVPQDIEPATADRLVSLLLGSGSVQSDEASREFIRVGVREMAQGLAGSQSW